MIFNHLAFSQDGYFIHQFEHLTFLKKINDVCETLCREEFPNSFISLAEYHQLNITAKEHDEFQYKVYKKVDIIFNKLTMEV